MVQRGTDNGSGSGFAELERTTMSYDLVGRRTGDRLLMAGQTYAAVDYSYDAASRLVCSAQRMNRNYVYQAPSDACVLNAEGSDGPDRIVRRGYTAADEVSEVRSACQSMQWRYWRVGTPAPA